MAGSINKVILVGNLGKDPEIRTTQDGKKIARLTLATGESWTDRQTGERKERTEWHNVSIFNENLVRIVENYLRKGSKVYVEGSLQTRKYTDTQGQERYATDVILQNFNGNLTLLDRNPSSGGGYGDSQPAYADSTGNASFGSSAPQVSASQPAAANAGFAHNDLDDDLPF